MLRSLQQVTDTNMPFQKYIVGEPPRYLTHTTTYDLTPLMKTDCITQGKKVAVRYKLWPPGEIMDLDKSQLEAVKSALTSEIAVVQGPLLIRGVFSNMFFINHERMEVSVTDGHSKLNEHEAMFLVKLCRYLLKQGYNPNQITILTTHSSQLFAFKKKMPRSDFTGEGLLCGQQSGGRK